MKRILTLFPLFVVVLLHWCCKPSIVIRADDSLFNNKTKKWIDSSKRFEFWLSTNGGLSNRNLFIDKDSKIKLKSKHPLLFNSYNESYLRSIVLTKRDKIKIGVDSD